MPRATRSKKRLQDETEIKTAATKADTEAPAETAEAKEGAGAPVTDATGAKPEAEATGGAAVEVPVESKEEPAAAYEPAPKKKKAEALKAGDALPDLPVLKDDEEKDVALNEVVKESGVVVFVYPKANTGGCTKQACGFNDNLDKFVNAGYKVYGLSADKPKSQASWKKKYSMGYALLSDPEFTALKALGVIKSAKSVNRSHIVVEKGGIIKDIRISISPSDSFTEALKTVM